MRDREALDEQISIRLTRRELARLDALSKRIAIASRNAIARKALQIGMTIIENDPGQVLASGARRRWRISRWHG